MTYRPQKNYKLRIRISKTSGKNFFYQSLLHRRRHTLYVNIRTTRKIMEISKYFNTFSFFFSFSIRSVTLTSSLVVRMCWSVQKNRSIWSIRSVTSVRHLIFGFFIFSLKVWHNSRISSICLSTVILFGALPFLDDTSFLGSPFYQDGYNVNSTLSSLPSDKCLGLVRTTVPFSMMVLVS